MAEYWTRDGPRVLVRLPTGILRIVAGGLLVVAGTFLLVALFARQTGLPLAAPALDLGDAVTAATFGVAVVIIGFVVAFYRHRIVIDGVAGSATFLHDFWVFRRARVVSLAEYTGVKIDRRAPVNRRHSSQAWYWVCLIGSGGRREEIVALGSPGEAEELRDHIAAAMGGRG